MSQSISVWRQHQAKALKASVSNVDGSPLWVEGYTASSAEVLERFVYGEELTTNRLLVSASTRYAENGDWDGNQGIGYVGFVYKDQKGWLKLDYQNWDADEPNIGIVSFAWGSEGEIQYAGIVPEPEHAVGIAALLAGGVALYQRRRKAK